MKKIPDKDILLFKSCLVSVEYPGVESSTAFLFDKLGVGYHRDQRQSCCTGLGHYYDLFDQLSTTALAARNFWVARDSGNPNIAVMCATCYAILKKSAEILNENDEAREKINGLLEEGGMGKMAYHKGDIDPHKNIFHAAEILYNKKDLLKDSPHLDFSQFNIATHHACHYCKVHYEDTIGGVRHPPLLDEWLLPAVLKLWDGTIRRTHLWCGFRHASPTTIFPSR
jgi:heterodisulfide reductase subunit B